MTDPRTANLLGALALGLADSIHHVVAAEAGSGGETPAALVTLGAEPGLSLNRLRQILNLSQPGTVRLIDRLATQGLVERRSGRDGRTLALYLTPTGQARRQAILRDRRRPLQQALQALSPVQQAQLTPLLETLLTALTTSETQGYRLCRLCDEAVCPSDRCPVELQCCPIHSP